MKPEAKKIDPAITWMPGFCKRCSTCIQICPVKNLEFRDEEMASLGKCIHCQLCEKYCPDFAIEAVPKKDAVKTAEAKT